MAGSVHDFANNGNKDKMYHLQMKHGDVGRYVILVEDPLHTDLIASQIEQSKLIAQNREHRSWTGRLSNERISVVSTGTGSASLAICVEELIKLGSDTFIFIGSAITVYELIQTTPLDAFICNAAVRDEGTTRHYMYPEYPAIANREIVEHLERAAQDENMQYKTGITYTFDSLYAITHKETCPQGEYLKNRLLIFHRGNVITSDMASSALYIISSIRKCRSGSILFVHDICKTISVSINAMKSIIFEDQAGKNEPQSEFLLMK